MFERKQSRKDAPNVYIGARVTEVEQEWLRTEMKRRKLTMSDLIRLALGKLQTKAPKASKVESAP